MKLKFWDKINFNLGDIFYFEDHLLNDIGTKIILKISPSGNVITFFDIEKKFNIFYSKKTITMLITFGAIKKLDGKTRIA